MTLPELKEFLHKTPVSSLAGRETTDSFSLHPQTTALLCLPDIAQSSEDAFNRHTCSQWQVAYYQPPINRSLPESRYYSWQIQNERSASAGKAEKGESSSANPSLQHNTCLNNLRHGRHCPSSCPSGQQLHVPLVPPHLRHGCTWGTWLPGVPWAGYSFTSDSASAGTKHLQEPGPTSPLCKSWGKACLLLSAVELF